MTPSPVVGEADLARLGVRLRDAQKALADRRRRNKLAECVAADVLAAELQQAFDARARAMPYSRLALLGLAMRDAQKAHAELLRKYAESQCSGARAKAYALQAKFEEQCRLILAAEQPVLPGCADEGGDT